MNVLWLVSWYPNKLNPYEGDFIQRHAVAVSSFCKVTVIYVSQAGENFDTTQNSHIQKQNENLCEKIYFFAFKKTGVKLLDKIIYNLKFYKTYKKILSEHIHESGRPGLIHVHVPIKAGLLARWVKKKWNIPYIVSEQSSWYNNKYQDSFDNKSSRYKQNTRNVFKSANAITNVSATIGQVLQKLFDLKEVKTIHNTVDVSLFKYTNRSLKKIRFIHVSTLTHQKNVEGILQATKLLSEKYNNFELVIVGPITSEQIMLINRLGISSHVTYTGEIPYSEVAVQMQDSSAFILFSRHENFPCVIIEALCSGLPCIASNVGGVAEAITDDNGILVDSENETHLSEAMAKMLVEYSKYDRAMIADDAKRRYSYATIGEHFFNLYKSIL